MSTYEIQHKLEKYNHKRRQAQSSDRIGYYDRKIQRYNDLLQTGGAENKLSDVIGKAVGDIETETKKANEIQNGIGEKITIITTEIKMIKDKIKDLESQVSSLREMNDVLNKIPGTLQESVDILEGKDKTGTASESSQSGGKENKGFFSELFN